MRNHDYGKVPGETHTCMCDTNASKHTHKRTHAHAKAHAHARTPTHMHTTTLGSESLSTWTLTGFRVSGFGFRVSGVGCRVYGLGLRTGVSLDVDLEIDELCDVRLLLEEI